MQALAQVTPASINVAMHSHRVEGSSAYSIETTQCDQRHLEHTFATGAPCVRFNNAGVAVLLATAAVGVDGLLIGSE